MKQTQTIPETFLGVGYTRGRAGLPLEAVRVPVPQPAADEVLIRVAASSLNPLEYKLADLNFMGRTPPVVLGLDLSGVVIAAGQGVRGFAVGNAVAAGGFERRWRLGRDRGERRRRRLCRGTRIPHGPQAVISELPRCRYASNVLLVRFRRHLRGRSGW